jgi:hypothetical protein
LLNIVATEIAVALDGIRWRTSQMATLYAVEHLDEAQYELGDLLEQILETTLAGWGAPRGAILLTWKNEDGQVIHNPPRP